MAQQGLSYNDDTKIVRIPIKVKEAIDNAKPPGIELWKFTADVIMLGLAALKDMRGNKATADVASYESTTQLVDAYRRTRTAK